MRFNLKGLKSEREDEKIGITHFLKSDVHFGEDANGRDVKFWSDTSGDFILFDASDKALEFTDCNIKFAGGEYLYLRGSADYIYSAGAGTMSITSAAITLSGATTITGTLTSSATGAAFLTISSTGATFVSADEATGTQRKLKINMGSVAYYMNVYTTG